MRSIRVCFLSVMMAGGFVCFHGAPSHAQDYNALRDRVNRGNDLVRARQFQAALGEYEAASKIDPANAVVKQNIAECYNNWGTALFRQKSYEDAVDKYKKCLEFMPGHGLAKHNLTLVYQTMEREGIPPLPEEADEKKPTPKEKKEKNEPQAKIVAGSQSDTVVRERPKTLFDSFDTGSGSSSYVTGSPLYPRYSTKPTAVSAPVETRFAPPAGQEGAPAGAPARPAANPQTTSPAAGSLPSSIPPATSRPDADPPVTPGDSAFIESQKPTPPPRSPQRQPAADTFAQGDLSEQASSYASGNAGRSDTAGQRSSSPEAGRSSRSKSRHGQLPVAPDRSGSPHPDAGAIDEVISQLEESISGRTFADMPYLKRLEQLELKLFKEVRTGAIDERVDFLRKKVGL